jgi:two-component system sensor histidine kinase UhpB
MRRVSLLTQVVVANLLVMLATVIVIALAADTSLSLSHGPRLGLILVVAVVVSVAVNAVITQRRFRPLEQLVEEMERADLARPGGASPPPRADPTAPEEVARLHHAFRVMLGRLEAERRRTSRAALQAQEQERARVARDLHDEVNQALTGLLLRLEGTSPSCRRRDRPPRRGPQAPPSARGRRARSGGAIATGRGALPSPGWRASSSR